MMTIIKWSLGALFAGVAWLVGIYADEYFRPYKKIKMGPKRKQ